MCFCFKDVLLAPYLSVIFLLFAFIWGIFFSFLSEFLSRLYQEIFSEDSTNRI